MCFFSYESRDCYFFGQWTATTVKVGCVVGASKTAHMKGDM